MPFAAAKAVAITFCWEIRYVLTPLFGADFPDLCIDPSNPAFMHLRIDPAIIKQCEEAAYLSRQQSEEALFVARSQTPTESYIGSQRTPKSLRPKMTDIESGYGTDSERSALGSPASSTSNLWTPVNIPRSTHWGQYQISTSNEDFAWRVTAIIRGPRSCRQEEINEET